MGRGGVTQAVVLYPEPAVTLLPLEKKQYALGVGSWSFTKGGPLALGLILSLTGKE